MANASLQYAVNTTIFAKFIGETANTSPLKPICCAEGRRYCYRGELVAETQVGNLFDLPVLKNAVSNLSLVPVDIKAMIAKNEKLMNGMIQRTLKEIYVTFKAYRNKVDLFYLAFSGSKDSLVMFDLVQRVLPHDSFEVIFGDTTMELSDTYKTVEETKKSFSDLKWHTARAPFDALDSWKFMGSPARKIRWCCPVHKAGQLLFKVKEIIADRSKCPVADVKNFKAMAFVGIRAEESAQRSTYDKIAMSRKHPAQLKYLCKRYCMNYVEQEESYTSKASFWTWTHCRYMTRKSRMKEHSAAKG